MLGFFDTVPRGEEAALLDGCNQFQVFLVMLPLSLPAVAVSSVQHLAAWNEFLLAPSQHLKRHATLPIAASMISSTGGGVTFGDRCWSACWLTVLVLKFLIGAFRWRREGVMRHGGREI